MGVHRDWHICWDALESFRGNTSITSIIFNLFFFFFPVMQIIHNNGKLKNTPFGLTGNFCTYNPRIRTPGGAALMATTDGEGLSSAGRTSTEGGWNRAVAQP